ncbi:MAG: RND family efflux transporter MFP subunit [Thalassolituus sp.]|jgi:RND family efflux transporter MFP subunit
MRISTYYVIVGLAVMSALSGCTETTPEVEAEGVRPAKIFQVGSPDEAQVRRFPAQVQSAERASLAFRVSGELLKLPAQSGQAVKEGDVLAALDPADYQVQVDDRKARYELAHAQYERVKNLFKMAQISQSQLDQAKADLDISKAALKTAQSDLSYTELKAPFDGTVANVFADNHQSINAGTTVAVLQVQDQLEVNLQVPESIMVQISQNSKTSNYKPETEFDALPNKRFKATYKEHTSQADSATGSYTVTLTLPRPENLNVLPGMSASVYVDLNKIFSQRIDMMVVPANSVFQQANQAQGSNQASVWLVKDDQTLTAVPVEVGKLTANGIEIKVGLNPGDKILDSGVHQAVEGMKIRPWLKERGL